MSIPRKPARREFQASASSSNPGDTPIVSLAVDQQRAERVEPSRNESGIEPVCDFQSSFMTWDIPYRKDARPHARHNIPHGNLARIALEALIDVIDLQSGASERFVLIAPCRTEWVYAENRLFQLPSGEYRNIYSLSHQRSLSRRITFDGSPAKGHPVSDQFRSLKIDVRPHEHIRPLRTAAEIVQATAANVPLIGRTQIDDPAGKLRYVLEYPIRTMNFQPITNSFQVDTGPLLVPDFDANVTKTIDRLEMAHVAYNRLDRAEFILRRPTPIEDDDGKELCRVLHYSEVQEHSAVNLILAGGA
jgi:hypothetical protein